MATFNKFYSLTQKLAEGVFDCQTDDLKVYLTNTAPDAETMTVFNDLPEIGAGNGYDAGGQSVNASVTSSLGVASVVAGNNVSWTATTGTIGPFASVVLYDDTISGNPLMAWWTYPGGSITLQPGETFTVQFGSSLFTVT